MNCNECSLNSGKKVLGIGPKVCDMIIVGEGPGLTEVKTGQPFTGRLGELLNRVLKRVGLKREDVYITNAVLCYSENGNQTTLNEIKCCRDRLKKSIFLHSPKIIVALGGTAACAVLNVSRISVMTQRGYFLSSPEFNCKVLITLHPAAVLRDLSLYSLFLEDFYKAANYVKYQPSISITSKKYVNLKTKEEVLKVLDMLEKKGIFAFDIETTGLNPWTSKILSYAFCCKDKEAYCIFTPDRNETLWSKEDWNVIEERLKTLLTSKKVKLVIQNAFYELSFFKVIKGWDLVSDFDTMLAHHLLDENAKGQHGLKKMATRYLDLLDYAQGVDVVNLLYTSDETFVNYTCSDVDATWRLYNEFSVLLKEEKLDWLFENIVMPLVVVIVNMYALGIKIDTDLLKELKHKYELQVRELVKKIKEVSGMNPASSTQLCSFLYDKLKLPVLNKTISGQPSTDIQTLKLLTEKVSDKNIKEFLENVLQFRKLFKLYRTYIIGIEKRLNLKTGCLHAEFLIHGTRTGRLSSVNPNLQNIAGEKDIKDLFIPRPGCKFIEVDYKQLEFRVFMNYIKDQKAFEDLKKGFDVHRVIASRVFGKPEGEVTEAERTLAKGVVFGLMYGMSTETLSSAYKLELQEAQEFVERFWRMYPAARQWVEKTKEFLKEKGYVVNMYGRRRRLPSVFSDEMSVKSGALRQGVNAPIQGAAADITNYGLIRIFNYLVENNYKARPLLQVHDSILIEVPDEEVEQVVEIVKNILTHIPGVDVCLDIDLKVVNRWGEVLE